MRRRRRNDIAFKSNPIHWFLLRYLLASLIRASPGWHHSGGHLWSPINQTCPQTVGRTGASEENPLRHQENMRKPPSERREKPPCCERKELQIEIGCIYSARKRRWERRLEPLLSAPSRAAPPPRPSEWRPRLFIDPPVRVWLRPPLGNYAPPTSRSARKHQKK